MVNGGSGESAVPLLSLDRLWASSIFQDFRESFSALFLVTIGNLITGIVLGVSTARLEMLPALIVLIPGAIDMRGNTYGSLGSRLGSYLHTGQVYPTFKRTKIIDENVFSAFILSLMMSIYLGFVASIFARAIGIEVSLIELTTISIFAGVISGFFLLWVTISIAFLSYRSGWDPDNLTSPLITVAGDMVTLPLLFISMDFVLRLPKEWSQISFAFFVLSAFLGVLYTGIRSSEMSYSKKILMESAPMFFVSGLLSTSSGIILGGRVASLIGMAGILTLLPAFLEDGGAISGILAAKLSSSLHLGSIEYSILPNKDSLVLFLFTHTLGAFVFTLMGSFAYFINLAIHLETPPLRKMVLASIIAGEVLILLMNFIVYYLSMISYRVGLDPDNTVIPTVTSLMDFFGTACLITTIILMGII